MLKYTLITIAIVILVAQLFQPSRAVPAIDPADDLLAQHPTSPEVEALVIGACYDCHSYRTRYPWYAYVRPVNFTLQRHIDNGRKVLNFSIWSQYARSEAAAECEEETAEGEMPPPEYARMHKHAQMTNSQRSRLIAYFQSLPLSRGRQPRKKHEIFGRHKEEDQ